MAHHLRDHVARVPLVTLTLCLLVATCADADTLAATVVGVHDGDSLVVRDAAGKPREVRIIGIDAPETGQPSGDDSRANLEKLAGGKQVVVNYDTVDSSNRIIGKVLVDGRDVGLEQLGGGFAWAYQHFPNEQTPGEQRTYRDSEALARRNRLGLWKAFSPQAPWEYRAAYRGPARLPSD